MCPLIDSLRTSPEKHLHRIPYTLPWSFRRRSPPAPIHRHGARRTPQTHQESSMAPTGCAPSKKPRYPASPKSIFRSHRSAPFPSSRIPIPDPEKPAGQPPHRLPLPLQLRPFPPHPPPSSQPLRLALPSYLPTEKTSASQLICETYCKSPHSSGISPRHDPSQQRIRNARRVDSARGSVALMARR